MRFVRHISNCKFCALFGGVLLTFCRFEAAWGGDLHTIKSLTLAPWGTSNNPPLEIATSDFQGFSPFHIAVLRDHHDVARVLVEISMAQYEPPEEDRPRTYRIGDADDESVSESSELAVYAELVDDKFTIDNIGEVATKVKSKCSPLSFMSSPFAVGKYAKYFLEGKKWTYGIDDQEIGKINERLCLQSWAITTNDRDLFAFLLDLDVEWTDRLAKKLDDSSGIPSFTESDFELAIQYGRVDFLAEMIKHGGAGMELSSLVQKSGVKYREKPKYYQGLSVSLQSDLSICLANRTSRCMARNDRTGSKLLAAPMPAWLRIQSRRSYGLRSWAVCKAWNGS